MRDLDISEDARRSGVAASALRHYEEKGLIAQIGRRGLRRLFDAGFSLDEMAGMLGDRGAVEIDRAVLAAKADQLEITIRRLGAMQVPGQVAEVVSKPVGAGVRRGAGIGHGVVP